jgi:hypothetical protein
MVVWPMPADRALAICVGKPSGSLTHTDRSAVR